MDQMSDSDLGSSLSATSVEMVALPPEPVRRLKVEEYHTLIKSGNLTEDDPYELLEGWLVPKITRNAPHDLAVQRVQRLFYRLMSSEWLCFVQSAATLIGSEPEPDIATVRGPDSRYVEQHPCGPDIGLIVEVGDTSLVRDRSTKLRSYARAGVPEYWILNLRDHVLERYTGPLAEEGKQPTYQDIVTLTRNERITICLAGKFIGDASVYELLPG
jgi:Uma2 family endonuclease